MFRFKNNFIIFFMLMSSGLAACDQKSEDKIQRINEVTKSPTTISIPQPEYIGNQACAGCHAEQQKAWQGSHHDLAMQHATPNAVLGNFNQADFIYNNVKTTLYRDQDQFKVRTEGPDGKLQDYTIKYTFGVDPLQQYLIELEDGRVQALGIAWDTRSKEEGGQRWFHLYPDQKVNYQHELHSEYKITLKLDV